MTRAQVSLLVAFKIGKPSITCSVSIFRRVIELPIKVIISKEIGQALGQGPSPPLPKSLIGPFGLHRFLRAIYW